jgi:hypothetical protein
MSATQLVLIAAAAALIGGPLLLGLTGAVTGLRARSPGSGGHGGWTWLLMAHSALSYAIAFNLVFFVQELALAGTKALVPGLHATLYHNNHGWTGDAPVAALLQGTGALVILTLGLACMAVLAVAPPRRGAARLLLFWLAFHGLFLALPQVVIGAVHPANDVGMAMAWLGFGGGAKAAFALLALAAMVMAGVWLTGPLLAFAPGSGAIDTPARRTGFVWRIATLPALAGTLLILPFRLPGPIVEVAVVPAVVAIAGLGWIQAGAWRFYGVRPRPASGPDSVRRPLFWLIVLLAFFQFVLRPGIAFS